MREHPVLSIGPLKSYFLLGKIQYKGQYAGNKIYSRESSETTRVAYILKDNLFKYWFIGFLEGKGSFILDKNGNLEFKIVHSSTDASLLFYIKKKLGFGIIRIQDKLKNNHCFKVNDEKGLFKLISILNSNLFLETKGKEFKLWIDAYNKKYGTTIICGPAIKNINKPSLSNYWLSGFTDAVGSFTCTIRNRPDNKCLVKLSYILRQKDNIDQMNYLAEILGGKVHNNSGMYEVTVNTTKLPKIINYLDIHPLKTKKSIIYFNIKKTYIIIKNNKFFTDGDLNLLTRYKNNIDRLSINIS